MNATAAAPLSLKQSRDNGFVRPNNIGFHIRIVQLRMYREFYRAFSGTGVTPGMHTVLAIIRDNPGIRQGVLAEALMVSPPNMSTAIYGLAKSGLVLRTVDPNDGRVFTLWLTEPGRRLLDEVQGRLDALEQRFLSNLDPDEQRQLRSLLDRILERLTR
jgi:DNA-binding MarR family transcriptional regulator